MPIAQKFKALGAGNGFSFCPSKRDVSGYDYWTTLSGVNKDNPTPSPELIAESLRLAMKFHWNADSLTCDATTTGTSRSGSISTVKVNYIVTDSSINPDDPVVIEFGPAVPVKRTCIPYYADPIIKTYEYSVYNAEESARMGVTSIVAMYDGATFVGYGLGYVETRFQSRGAIEAEAGGNTQLNAGVYAGGYGYTPDNTSNDNFDAGYVTFEGMELFAYLEAKNRPNVHVAGTVNLSELSATCVNSAWTATATASLDSIDFYTYPE